ncbi:hypothetical protein K1719_034714 [Acacia pycnantha]|nr:hypothetical protein K1719_034714 [Acacia pycnantha]
MPLNLYESRVYNHDDNVTASSESGSWAAEKTFSSDNQISLVRKGDKLQKRVPDKGSIKADDHNPTAGESENKVVFTEMEEFVWDLQIYEEGSLKTELENMSQQMSELIELIEKLEKAEAEKAELEIALMKSEDCIEASQLQLREVEMTLEEMQRELEAAYKSRK